MPVRTFNSTEAVREFVNSNLKTDEVSGAFLLTFAGRLVEKTGTVGENEILCAFGFLSQETAVRSMCKIPMYSGIYGTMLADHAIQYRAGRKPEDLDNLTVEMIVKQRTTL